MQNTLRNFVLSVTVKQHGAELCGLKTADGTEYMWQADPAVWPRHAPLLFPIVGKLVQGRYLYDGKKYEITTPHGFARDTDFELVAATESTLSYRLQATKETRKQYPFEFTLLRHYRLATPLEGHALSWPENGGRDKARPSSSTLEVTTEVTNPGAVVMPFSIGEHPAFSLKWGAGDKVEDYALQFEKPERLVAHLLDANGLLSDQSERLLSNQRVLPLRSTMFDRDALIFLKLNSRSISLCSRRHARRVTVEFPGYPNLGIWAKPGAPFVCIEPWYGYADPATHNGELLQKPGIILLEPGKTFTCTWRIGL
jgi:galactose mutarotase-like enzyme